jgi:formamidopyrimidine-DNA glycosylase
MPELPEVERGRRLAATIAEGRRIQRVRCVDDRIVFDDQSPRQVQRSLVGRHVRAVCRRGKQIWFELDGARHPLFHFGMAGAFHVPGVQPLKLASSGRRDTGNPWPPRHLKIHLWMDDGGELVMTDKRRFGRIRLRRDPPNEPPISKLGFDPLLDMPSPRAFASRVGGRRVAIKSLLLDQSFAAGVGNWIADEVLYQAGIDPRRRSDTLSERELRRLRARLRAVVGKAVAVDAQKHRFPRTWLFHHRWGKSAEARTARGEKIEFLEIGGRTTAWVPRAQE